MNIPRNVCRTLVLVSVMVFTSVVVAGGLEDLLEEIDVRAKMDIGSYKADLSVIFDVNDRKVSGMLEVMSKPSDVYMCLRIGEVAGQPIERVLEVYRRNEGQGWGVIAKDLGIKPGSSEFHALKADRLGLQDGSSSAGKKNKGKRGGK